MELTEQEIAQKLDKMRENALLDLHEWESCKGSGIIINLDGTIYLYSWFLGFNNKTNSFGMCTNLDKKDITIDCDLLKNYFLKEIRIFDIEYDTNFRDNGGCDIVVKFDGNNKYSNNVKLYKEIKTKIDSLLK